MTVSDSGELRSECKTKSVKASVQINVIAFFSKSAINAMVPLQHNNLIMRKSPIFLPRVYSLLFIVPSFRIYGK